MSSSASSSSFLLLLFLFLSLSSFPFLSCQYISSLPSPTLHLQNRPTSSSSSSFSCLLQSQAQQQQFGSLSTSCPSISRSCAQQSSLSQQMCNLLLSIVSSGASLDRNYILQQTGLDIAKVNNVQLAQCLQGMAISGAGSGLRIGQYIPSVNPHCTAQYNANQYIPASPSPAAPVVPAVPIAPTPLPPAPTAPIVSSSSPSPVAPSPLPPLLTEPLVPIHSKPLPIQQELMQEQNGRYMAYNEQLDLNEANNAKNGNQEFSHRLTIFESWDWVAIMSGLSVLFGLMLCSAMYLLYKDRMNSDCGVCVDDKTLSLRMGRLSSL